jgi:hypothetical protein
MSYDPQIEEYGEFRRRHGVASTSSVEAFSSVKLGGFPAIQSRPGDGEN